MEARTSGRRRFLAALVTCCVGILGWGRRAVAGTAQPAAFWIAGVRFYERKIREREGDLLELRRESFRGWPCLAIHGNDGTKIGYVPRRHLPELLDGPAVRVRLVKLRPTAVPWRRFRVTPA